MIQIFFVLMLTFPLLGFGPKPSLVDTKLSKEVFQNKGYKSFNLTQEEFGYRLIRSDGLDDGQGSLGNALHKISINPLYKIIKSETSIVGANKIFSFTVESTVKQIVGEEKLRIHILLSNKTANVISYDGGQPSKEPVDNRTALLAMLRLMGEI